MNVLTTFNTTNTTNATLTMSSREIAELTGKMHTHVIRDIRVMLDGLKDEPNLVHVTEEKDARGYTACFYLPKDLTITLVSGYNVQMRYAITKRWMELEAQQTPALPATFAEALRLVAELEEQKEQLRLENEAMKPDALVGMVVGQGMHLTVVDFISLFPGVNKTKIQSRLGELGYLYRRKGTWRVRSQYRDKLFAERFSSEGLSVVVVLEKGKKKLVDLYLNDQFVMKKGRSPVSAEILEDILSEVGGSIYKAQKTLDALSGRCVVTVRENEPLMPLYPQ